jgi:hypothetical protein
MVQTTGQDGYGRPVQVISYEELLGASGLWCPACTFPAADRFMVVRLADGIPSDATSVTICEQCGSSFGPDGSEVHF